jgi:hypothetical chaperone protein
VAALEALVEGNYAFYLFQEIERAKSELSEREATTIRFDHDVIHIKERVQRTDFEALIAADRERIQRCMHGVLQAAGLQRADVDAVFLTGGSAQIPVIRRMFAEEFGEEKLKSKDYLTSVAVGLGLTALRKVNVR